MSDKIIQMQGVHKYFGGNHVLRGVDLAIESGQTFALLGRNGAGKTTMIQLLMGLIRRNSGSLSVRGIDPEFEPLRVKASVGYLAEDQQMFGWMTVADILSFMAPFHKNWDDQLADRYAREFELPRKTRIENLSKGQNVRLGLILALAHRPEVMILDDPALGLDPIMRKEFNRDLITHLQSEGRTVLYSSHLLYEVEPIADVIAILKDGVIVKQSATEPLRKDVKQFVLSVNDYLLFRDQMTPLDVRRERNEIAVTTERSEEVLAKLNSQCVQYRVIDLNLDDIFAAYVAGKIDAPIEPSTADPIKLSA